VETVVAAEAHEAEEETEVASPQGEEAPTKVSKTDLAEELASSQADRRPQLSLMTALKACTC